MDAGEVHAGEGGSVVKHDTRGEVEIRYWLNATEAGDIGGLMVDS